MTQKESLILNIDKVHTTKMGEDRIKRNLSLNVTDAVSWCKQKIQDSNSNIYRKGKNWYIEVDNYTITINANSYTIITAHKTKMKVNK